MNKLLFSILLAISVTCATSAQATTTPTSTSIAPQSLTTTGEVSCVTQMTQMASANCTNSTSGQNYCTSSSTGTGMPQGLQQLNSPAQGGELCPGTYNASFAGCWMVSGNSCGGNSCGGWSDTLYATNITGGGSTQLVSNSQFWIGTGATSQSNYKPKQGITFFMPLATFNAANKFYHTATMKDLYFTVGLENDNGDWQNTGTVVYCILSLYQISTNPNVTGLYP